MKPTTREIASAAGVSAATVSRYFTGSEAISPELKCKIENALKALNVQPEEHRNRKKNVLVLLTHLRFSFYSRAVQELLDCEPNGCYSFIIARYDPENPESVWNVAARTHPIGVIYFEEEIDSGILRRMQGSGIRTVMCGGVAIDSHSDMVHVNDIRASYDGTKYLLELGHRDVLFLSDDISKIGAGYQRLAGCRKAMEEAGISFPAKTVICGSVTYRSGYDAVRRAISEKLPFTAVFAFSDELAVGAMAAIYDAGLRVPQDVSVLGYDDLYIAEQVRPRLTTIHQPIDQFVRKALELLELSSQSPNSEVMLPHAITKRDSCERRLPSA